MKRYLCLLIAVLAGLLWVQTARLRTTKADAERLAHNQTALMSELVHYRTRAGQEAASAQVLRLRCSEFEQLRAADAGQIRALGIKLRRVEATAKAATAAVVELRAALHDTVVVRGAEGVDVVGQAGASGRDAGMPTCPEIADPTDRGSSRVAVRPGQLIADTLRVFRWRDPWVRVEGLVDRDSVACRVESIDTLRQVIHRVPRRFLFIRWGTKAIRQEVVSANPHTRIVYTEYVKLEK